MEVEFAAESGATEDTYELALRSGVLDWAPLLHELLHDLNRKVPAAVIAAKFQHALVEALVAIAQAVGEERVVLTGGCFQNKLLTERAVRRLREAGFVPAWHQRVPPNDGGLALGQVLAAAQAPDSQPS
jgi:hydrogenase maturation protein HypF